MKILIKKIKMKKYNQNWRKINYSKLILIMIRLVDKKMKMNNQHRQ